MCEGSNNSREQAHCMPLHSNYPVSCPEIPVTTRCCSTANFSYLSVRFWRPDRRKEVSWQDSKLLGCFISVLAAVIIHRIILQIQSYFCKVVPGQLWPSTSAISQLHQQEITIRWQSTNAFLRCGLLVAGEGCISEPLVSELSVLGLSRTD